MDRKERPDGISTVMIVVMCVVGGVILASVAVLAVWCCKKKKKGIPFWGNLRKSRKKPNIRVPLNK